MPEICLLGDTCTGHDGYPPRPNSEADDYLVVNGRAVHCVGHGWQTHCKDSCHASNLAGGSSYFFVNGQAVGRVGDPVACGSAVATGDPYFIIEN